MREEPGTEGRRVNLVVRVRMFMMATAGGRQLGLAHNLSRVGIAIIVFWRWERSELRGLPALDFCQPRLSIAQSRVLGEANTQQHHHHHHHLHNPQLQLTAYTPCINNVPGSTDNAIEISHPLPLVKTTNHATKIPQVALSTSHRTPAAKTSAVTYFLPSLNPSVVALLSLSQLQSP